MDIVSSWYAVGSIVVYHQSKKRNESKSSREKGKRTIKKGKSILLSVVVVCLCVSVDFADFFREENRESE